MRAGWRVVLALGLAASASGACGSSSESDAPSAPGAWLEACSDSATCATGECVCGVCTEVCEPGSDSGCSQPLASCFASGSVGHAAVCRGTQPAGICLPACALDADCAEGFTCTTGTCVPASPATPPGAEQIASGLSQRFDESWGGFLMVEPLGPAQPCDDPALCVPLEALLATDTCFEVQSGCGLTFVHASPLDVGSTSYYWYDSFGVPPLAVYDAGQGALWGTLPEACSIDISCSSCGPRPVRTTPVPTPLACQEVPRALPDNPPQPAPVAGCHCEPDGAGNARVSLDCFCSLYPCPSEAELKSACSPPGDPSGGLAGAARDSCGQLWLSDGDYTGHRYAYAESGDLLGAIAFSQGPLTAPCGSYQVSAGIEPCAIEEQCGCRSNYGSHCTENGWLPP